MDISLRVVVLLAALITLGLVAGLFYVRLLGGVDLAAVRQHFETTWVRWNLVRAVAATGSFGCLAWAALR